METTPIKAEVKIYQYIDDVLIGGKQVEAVRETPNDIITHLESIGLTIPPEKIQTPSSEVKFLGIWWKGDMTCIPPDTLSSLDQIQMPESKKDFKHALGLLVFWRKRIPDLSITARPLYDLLGKRAQWEWTQVHDEALQLLVFEVNAYQALGPIQKGPEGPVQLIGFYSRSFKDAEKRSTTWEKGLFVVSLALREAERTTRQQSIVLRGPFKVIKAVLAGTPPPDGVAQRASVREWYAQTEHYCETFSVSEGAAKVLNIQDEVNPDRDASELLPVIEVAPPFSGQLQNVWFMDASSKREGKIWKYRAVALRVDTEEQIITEGIGSAQVGELIAVWSVFQHEAQSASSISILILMLCLRTALSGFHSENKTGGRSIGYLCGKRKNGKMFLPLPDKGNLQ